MNISLRYPTVRRALELALLPTALACVLGSLSGCGGDVVDPYILRVRSINVVTSAVDELEIVFRPDGLEQFQNPEAMMPEAGVTTRISAAGEFVWRADRSYIEPRLESDEDGAGFAISIPFYSVEDENAVTVRDPLIVGTVIRKGERITSDNQSRRNVIWPLVSGQQDVLTVTCVGAKADVECMNLDPAE